MRLTLEERRRIDALRRALDNCARIWRDQRTPPFARELSWVVYEAVWRVLGHMLADLVDASEPAGRRKRVKDKRRDRASSPTRTRTPARTQRARHAKKHRKH